MISIIVPVYNVEAYLPRCLDSILAQTCEDYEVLLIDDGSTDNSGLLCDRYSKQDKRIRAFHKKNGGVSDARNYGLDRIKGDYLTFIDPDDYVGPEYLSVLYDMLIENQADIACVHSIETWDPGVVETVSEGKTKILSRIETMQQVLSGQNFGVMLWGKLFRVELFEDIFFPVGQICEDLAVMPQLVHRCRQTVRSSEVHYYYFQRRDSLSNIIKESEVRQYMSTAEWILTFTQENYPYCILYAQAGLVRRTLSWIIDRLVFSPDYLRLARKIKRKYARYMAKVWILPNLTLKERFKATLLLINCGLFRWIRRRMLIQKSERRNSETIGGHSDKESIKHADEAKISVRRTGQEGF